MSADNYYRVRKHPKGGFAYVMGFASEDNPDLTVKDDHPQFATLGEAFNAAMNEYSEYGVDIDPECLPDTDAQPDAQSSN